MQSQNVDVLDKQRFAEVKLNAISSVLSPRKAKTC